MLRWLAGSRVPKNQIRIALRGAGRTTLRTSQLGLDHLLKPLGETALIVARAVFSAIFLKRGRHQRAARRCKHSPKIFREMRAGLSTLSPLRFPLPPFVLGLDHPLQPMREAVIVIARHRVRPLLEARSDLRVDGRRANFRFGLLHADFITANRKTANAAALYYQPGTIMLST